MVRKAEARPGLGEAPQQRIIAGGVEPEDAAGIDRPGSGTQYSTASCVLPMPPMPLRPAAVVNRAERMPTAVPAASAACRSSRDPAHGRRRQGFAGKGPETAAQRWAQRRRARQRGCRRRGRGCGRWRRPESRVVEVVVPASQWSTVACATSRRRANSAGGMPARARCCWRSSPKVGVLAAIGMDAGWNWAAGGTWAGSRMHCNAGGGHSQPRSLVPDR